MPRFARIIAISTATLALAGATAGGAGAIGYNGGPFTATAPSNHIFTISGFYDVECSSASATGNASGSATLPLTMSFTGCDLLGFPATVTTSAPWDVMLVSAPGGSSYGNSLTWATGTTTTITIPIAACTVTIPGLQAFTHGAWLNSLTSENQTGGVEITSDLYGAVYTASGCPFPSGSDGQYTGTFFLPGVAIY
jgi:hypothetical protein